MNNVRAGRILFVATGLFWFAEYAYVPYFNPYMNGAGIGASVVGLIGGSYGMAQLLLRMPIGILSDRYRAHKGFILFGMLSLSAAGFGLFFSRTAPAFLIFRCLSGIAAATWVSFTVLYAGYFTAERSVGSVSRVVSANNMGKLAAFFFGGYVAQHMGVEYTFLLSGVMGAAGFILSLFLTGSGAALAVNEVSAVSWDVCKNRNLVHIAVLGALAQTMAYGSLYTYSSDIAKQAGATAYQLSVINVILTLPSVFFAYFSAEYVLKKFGANKTIGAAFFTMCVYCLLYPFAGPVWQFYLLSLFAGLGNGIIFAILTGLCIENIDPAKKTTAMGFFTSVYGIGMTLGPVITGFMIDLSGMAPAFFLLAGFSFAGMVSALVWLERKKAA